MHVWHESQVRPVLWCRMLLIFGGMETHTSTGVWLVLTGQCKQEAAWIQEQTQPLASLDGWGLGLSYMLLQVQSSLSYILVSEQITAGSTAAAILLPYYMGLGRQGLTQNAVGGKTPGILLPWATQWYGLSYPAKLCSGPWLYKWRWNFISCSHRNQLNQCSGEISFQFAKYTPLETSDLMLLNMWVRIKPSSFNFLWH